MATTTNYGWITPDDTDLVKDGAAAIRTLGSSVDTTTKALNPETTAGDISYRSATANTNTRLAIGTAGQVLQVNAGATAPEWATPAGGGGKVLQVISATTDTTTNITSGSYTDTSITATITPTLATSKILIMIAANTLNYSTSTTTFVNSRARIMRGATAIMTNPNVQQLEGASAGTMSLANQNSFIYLDSPATTSATTYKLQAAVGTGTGVRYQIGSAENTSTITLMEIGV